MSGTSTCFTSRIRKKGARKYTILSARAIAMVLATGPEPEAELCPHLNHPHRPAAQTEKQLRTDPMSITQQLCNTLAVRGAQYSASALHELSKSEKRATSEPYLTCERMIDFRDRAREHSSGGKRHRRTESWDQILSKARDNPPFQSLSKLLSSYQCLASSFIVPDSQKLETGLFDIFKGWDQTYQTIIFDSLWVAIEPLFESPFSSGQTPCRCGSQTGLRAPPASHFHTESGTRLDNAPAQTLPAAENSSRVARVAIVGLYALAGSIPKGTSTSWPVVLATLVNAKAYGKQRYIVSDPYTSPWLHMLDSFESVSGLRFAKRLVRAIAARSCLEETLKDFPPHQRLRYQIASQLTYEGRSNDSGYKPYRNPDTLRKLAVGTLSLVLLEWFRKCFLKEWDGKARVHRWGVAGAALEMMETLWLRNQTWHDIPDEIFPVPILLARLPVEKLAEDWLAYKRDPEMARNRNYRHMLSFSFILPPHAMTQVFRTINHLKMEEVYGDAQTVNHLRHRYRRGLSQADRASLDRRLRIAQEHYLVLKVNREHVLEYALNQVWHRELRELFRPLRVRMGLEEGEIGHDLGGVQIEFFKLVCSEAFGSGYCK